MNDIDLVAAAISVCLVIVGIVLWHSSRSRSILEQWAEKENYQILEKEYRIFRRGSFFWTSSKGQVVYYVKIRDSHGVIRSGLVRCGSWWAGVFSDKTEVKWNS